MTSFASLMALSATHTREAQQAVNSALQERKRKEALQRKQQEEREAKEREQAKKLRMRIFEEEKRQKERMEKLEAERRAKEAARERKEEEQKNALLYGPKKAAKLSAGASGSPKYPSSSSGVKDAVRMRRLPDEDADDGFAVLTREEIRQRKKDAEMRRQFGITKRSSHSAGSHHRTGRTMPGGAVNIVVNANGQQTTASTFVSDPSSGKSLKERLTQGPNTLTLLRTQARDRRTVDEAQQDIRLKLGKATNKVLSGEEARSFDDWFGGGSKEKEKPSPGPMSKSSTPVPTASSSSSRQINPGSANSTLPSQKKANNIQRPSSTRPLHTSTAKSSTAVSRASSSEKHMSSSSSQAKTSKSTKSSSAPIHRSSVGHRETQFRSKRPRSPSLSESPPPSQRRKHYQEEIEDDDPSALSQQIWAMFGKNKSQYMSRDVFSDEEDMEADASDLEREEHVSARIAKREELLAQEAERRHEEEKRRRKKERERAAARGH